MPVGNNTIADHQSQAGSRTDSFGGVEQLEDVQLNFGRNSAAVVGDFHNDLIVVKKSGNANFADAFCGVNCVVD